jgi:glycosyltransferase involved in cell wall biosynthesis
VGTIVLDGMPFVPYTLRALYPHVEQIVVVEGAAPGARGIAGLDGHSRDGTLEELRRFAAEEDPEGKLTVVTAEDEGHPDGFWPGEKVEQSRAYARRADGDYLWQVDVDEFYLPADLARVRELLTVDPGITADGWYLRRGGADFHRLFKWGDGYTYEAHRPPTVLDAAGRDLRTLRWLDGRATARLGIVMRHYSLLFPKQVREKVEYYANWGLFKDMVDPDRVRSWMEDSYLTLRKPYRVHNVYRMPSWLERYTGEHPPEVRRMMTDIAAGHPAVETRPLADVERLLRSPLYTAGREALRLIDPVDDWLWRTRWSMGPRVRQVLSRGRA